MWRFGIKWVLRKGEEKEEEEHGSDGPICSEEGRANVQQAEVRKCMYICIDKPASFV